MWLSYSKDKSMIQSNTNPPLGYEKKFANFIKACRKAKQDSIPHIIIDQPRILGDTYEEIIESLSRLAEAKLALHITSR